MRMRRKTMVLAGLHWCILVLCHIVLCSHSLRHTAHRGHSSLPLSSSSGGSGADDSDDSDTVLMDSSSSSVDDKSASVAAIAAASSLLSIPSTSSSTSSLDSSSTSLDGDGEGDPGPITAAVMSSKGVDIHSLAQLKIKPGHELKLKCELNNTYGRIMWLLNGQPIRTDNGRYSIQGPSVNRAIEGRLTINNVLPEDNGIWQCHETKFDGKEHLSKPIWVIVLAAPRAVHLEFDGRRLSPSSSSSTRVTYREKDNISIDCVVEGGNPQPRLWWFMNGKNLTNISKTVTNYLDDEKVYLTRSSLRIENVSRNDHNKSVICIVDHELLLSSSSSPDSYLRAQAHFNIEYTPSFIISRNPAFGYPIREGIALALKCDIDANPMSRPIWMKDGGDPPVPQSDGFLNFTQIRRNDTGWYKCVSNHPMGKASSVGYYLNVRYEPTIVHQPPARIEANLGEKVHMKCEADGRPSPALCWSRIGYGGSLTAVGSGQELILENILYQEAGNYRCSAQNRIGLEERRVQTHDVQVVVTGRPVVYPTNRTIMGFAGQPLSLSVEICANPIPERAFWIFASTALRPGSRYRNKYVAQKLTISESADCYLAVLTILNVSTEDAGEYMFFVKNSKGIHEGTILLNITQASFSVSSSTSRAYRLHSSSSHPKLPAAFVCVIVATIQAVLSTLSWPTQTQSLNTNRLASSFLVTFMCNALVLYSIKFLTSPLIIVSASVMLTSLIIIFLHCHKWQSTHIQQDISFKE